MHQVSSRKNGIHHTLNKNESRPCDTTWDAKCPSRTVHWGKAIVSRILIPRLFLAKNDPFYPFRIVDAKGLVPFALCENDRRSDPVEWSAGCDVGCTPGGVASRFWELGFVM